MKILKRICIILIISFSFFSISFGNGDLTSPSFMINPNDIYPGINAPVSGSSNIANWFLGSLIQNMMIVLGTISILVMTVGAGYMILHNGQDDMLTKGKTVFMSGIYAMVIALAAYYIVAILRFILYS